jgi:nucleotide-binding universal stress UspA family protein
MSEGPVVVGTDGSAGAARAVLWATQEAALRHQPLHIVCAVGLDLAERLSDETARRVREAARSLLAEAEAAASGRAPGLAVSTEVGREPAADSLLRAAASTAPQAPGVSTAAVTIVVGSRGLGGFSTLLLGSVGLTVAGQARCPVVVVRGTKQPSNGVVVVGVRDEGDLEAVRFAAETARRRKASLRLLSTWTYLQYIATMAPMADAVRVTVETGAAASTRFLGSVREEFPDLEVTEEVVRVPSPAGELVAASMRADLVVVGARRPAHHVGRALGRVTHAVLQHAHCPVAVVPRE